MSPLMSIIVMEITKLHYVYTMSALHDIKYKVHSRDANKTRGKAECFISIETAR